jgi:hypothetical protein
MIKWINLCGLTLLAFIIFFNLSVTAPSQPQPPQNLESRFELVETVLLYDDTRTPSDYEYSTRIGGRLYARIFRDKVTGVEYLYAWIGAANGGPMITRYYRQ